MSIRIAAHTAKRASRLVTFSPATRSVVARRNASSEEGKKSGGGGGGAGVVLVGAAVAVGYYFYTQNKPAVDKEVQKMLDKTDLDEKAIAALNSAKAQAQAVLDKTDLDEKALAAIKQGTDGAKALYADGKAKIQELLDSVDIDDKIMDAVKSGKEKVQEMLGGGNLDEKIAALMAESSESLEALSKKLGVETKDLVARARSHYDESVAQGKKVFDDAELEKKFKAALKNAEAEGRTWTEWALSWVGMGKK